MAYIRLEYPKIQVLDDDGKLAVGWKIYTYVAGTTNTDVTTWSERTLTTENTNPIVLNARGEADIFTNQAIKLVLKTDVGALIWEQDYVGEVIATFYTGSSTGTTDNVYDITVSPIPSAYTANMTIIFTPDVDNVETVGVKAFTGTGPNDCQFRGPYIGSTSSTFRVEIDGVSSPNTFKWRKDSEAYVATVPITGAWQTLKEGMEIKFSVLTGHINADYWTQAVDPPAKANVNGLGDKLIYKNFNKVMQVIDGGDILANYPATLVYSDVQDCMILNNPASITSSGSAYVGTRTRTEKTTDYLLSVNDAGNLIDFTNATAAILTMDPAANYNGMFFYIRAGGAGNVTITAYSPELIYGPHAPAGGSTYVLKGGIGTVVQLQCNGVSWEILTETGGLTKTTFFIASGTFTHDPDTRSVIVEIIGRGGTGGAGSGGGIPYGGGGGGGGYVLTDIPVASLLASETVTIGATCSFGAHATVPSGADGTEGAGGLGSTGVGGFNLTGETGHAYTEGEYIYDYTGGKAAGPYGGFGGAFGLDGSFPGGGGGGNAFSSPVGAGGTGLVIVTEYK